LNVALDVPSEVSDAFGVRGYVPVVGTVDGCPLTATLVPKGNGGHRMFLNAEVRTTIGKRPGQKVRLALRFDPAERMPDVPEDLQSSLRGAKAIDAWAALPPSRRRELLVYIADAKRQDTRKRRIRRVVDRLVPGAD
jgi:hypothetical protein